MLATGIPCPRWYHFFAAVKRHQCIYGGRFESEKGEFGSVHLFSCNSEKWKETATTGQHPPLKMLWHGGCCSHKDLMFIQGGQDGKLHYNTLYQLDTLTSIPKWTQLSSASDEGAPMKKRGQAMVYHAPSSSLLVFGGRGPPPTSPTQPEALYEKFMGDVLTNELHKFQLSEGKWSSPAVTGAAPPPAKDSTLTMVDDDRAVLFGGRGGGVCFNHLYELDIKKMEWIKHYNVDKGPWPRARSGHGAVCLGFDENHAQLLVIGGGNDFDSFNDAWMLDLTSWKWRKIEDIDIKPRRHHSTTTFTISQDVIEVVMFGGKDKDNLNSNDTVLLRFEHQPSKGDSPPTREWIFKSKATGSELGAEQRIKEKKTIQGSELEPISSNSDNGFLSRSELEFCANIEKHLKKSGAIDRFLAHLVFVGLPASGKTTLIARLLNLEVILEASRSTGVMDGIITVSIGEDRATLHAANVDEQTSEKSCVWHKVEFNLSCLRLMGMLPVDQPSEYNDHDTITSHEEVAAKVAQNDSTPADCLHDHIVAVANQPTPHSVVPDDHPLRAKLETVEAPNRDAFPEKSRDYTILLENIQSVLREKGYSAEGFSKIRPFLKNKTTLYLSDTGGQIEFQELLPLLVAGYAIFLFLFPLNKDLDKPVCVNYRKKDGNAINDYTSTLTIEESFLQTLSSIDSMRSGIDPTAAKDDSSLSVSTQFQHDPAVFVIGTHKDCLIKELQSESAAEEEIARIDDKIKSLVEEHGYGDLVMHTDRAKKEILFAVDNTCENDVFEKIRSRIITLIRETKTFHIEFPLSYLLASMHLEGKSGPFIKRSDFAKDIVQYGIEEEDVDHLLHFLHTRIGQIRYFPLKEIEEDIVKEPQALYDIVTDLVTESFLLPSTMAQDSEVKRGIYSIKFFEKHSHVLEPKKIIALLTALRIVAPFKSSKEEKYFIPCVLNHLEKPPKSKACETSGIQPLAILFSCGHCPKGMFGVLLHYILTQDDEKSLDWNLIESEIFRDQVSFKVGAFRNKVTIKFHTTYLEVKYCPTSVALHDPISTEKKVCNKIRSVLVSGIKEATRSLRYSPEKTKFSFGLVCTSCGSAHEVTKGYSIECSIKRIYSALPNSGSFWFGIPTYSFSDQFGEGGTITLKKVSNLPQKFSVSSESSCSQPTLTKIDSPTHRANHVYLEQNSIIFKDILECDEGVYRVFSRNDVGSGQISFELKLKRPTKYNFSQRFLKGVAGSSPTLEFSVDPPVPEDTEHILRKENGKSAPARFEVKHDRIIFHELKERDSGEYITSCHDIEGELVKETLELEVMPSHPSHQHAPAAHETTIQPATPVKTPMNPASSTHSMELISCIDQPHPNAAETLQESNREAQILSSHECEYDCETFELADGDRNNCFAKSLLKLNTVHNKYDIIGSNTRLAIIERGCYNTHKALNGKVKMVEVKSFDGSLNHGTAVAGIAAGQPYTSGGASYPGGVAPDAEVTMFCVDKSTNSLLEAVKQISEFKGDNSFDVLSISLGTDKKVDGKTEDQFQKAIQKIKEEGTVIFAASGNAGKHGRVLFPAYLEGVIKVGALDRYWGLLPSAMKKGLDIYCCGEVLAPTSRTDKLELQRGSSMATPVAAGLACLAIQLAKDCDYKGLRHNYKILSLFEQFQARGRPHVYEPETFLVAAYEKNALDYFNML